MFSSNQQLNYQFLLITHIVCADQQIHSEEAQALRDLAKAANIEENTLLEMEKILSQEDKYLSLELIAGKIPHGQHTETMRQLLTMAHIDGYFAPLEREMIYKIGQVWHWSKNEIDKIIQEAKSKQTQKNNKNNEDEELSLAAKFLENEYKSGLSRAISNRSRGVQKTLYMRFHENSMKNVIDLIFLGHLKFAKSLYRFANRFLANLRTIR